jgi:antitoxin VapB
MLRRNPGSRVRGRRVEGGIPLNPMATDVEAWFAALDRFVDVPFMEEGRKQPPKPTAEELFESTSFSTPTRTGWRNARWRLERRLDDGVARQAPPSSQ